MEKISSCAWPRAEVPPVFPFSSLRVDAKRKALIWNWFYEHFPKCMKLVPKRRMDQFVAGVSKAHENGRLDD